METAYFSRFIFARSLSSPRSLSNWSAEKSPFVKFAISPFSCTYLQALTGLQDPTSSHGNTYKQKIIARSASMAYACQITLAFTPRQSGVPESKDEESLCSQSDQPSPSPLSSSCSHGSLSTTIEKCAYAHCVARMCSLARCRSLAVWSWATSGGCGERDASAESVRS